MEKQIIKPNVTLADIQEFFNPILQVKKYEKNYKEAKIKNIVAISRYLHLTERTTLVL